MNPEICGWWSSRTLRAWHVVVVLVVCLDHLEVCWHPLRALTLAQECLRNNSFTFFAQIPYNTCSSWCLSNPIPVNCSTFHRTQNKPARYVHLYRDSGNFEGICLSASVEAGQKSIMFPWEYNPDLELRWRRTSTRSFFSDEMTKDLFIVLSVHAFSLLVLLQPGDWAEDLGYVAED